MNTETNPRFRLAESIDAYVECRIDSAQLEAVMLETRNTDQSCRQISNAMELFIDDFSTHRNEGKFTLDVGRTQMLVRWACLLRSDANLVDDDTARNKNIFHRFLSAFRHSSHECLNNEYWPFESPKDWRAIFGAIESETKEISP